MPHTSTLKLVPADLDRAHAVLVRAGVARPGTTYTHPFELLADLEHLATLAVRPPTRAHARGGEGVLSRS